MKARMALATVIAVAGLALGGAAPASADTKNGFTSDIVCDTLGTVTIITFSRGAASPGLVVDSNRVILAYEWQFEGTYTPTGGEPIPLAFSYSRAAPRNGRLDYCISRYDVFYPEGVVHWIDSPSSTTKNIC